MGDLTPVRPALRLRAELREESGPRRGQLPFGRQHALRGDANVVVRLQRLLDEAAKGLVLEQVEPLRVAQRGLRGLGFAGPELRRRRHVGTLVVGPDHAAGEGGGHAEDEKFAAH